MRFLPFTAPRHFTGCAAALLLIFLLSGCSQTAVRPGDQSHPAISEPEKRVVDYQQVGCENIWAFNTDSAIRNPLYWLRAMDCAQRLSPAEARAEAHHWPEDDWQSRFKQAVLYSNGKVTPVERHQYLQRFDESNVDYPAAVRPLITVWRQGQGTLLQLSAERSRLSALQQSNEAQLSLMRQQQTALQHELRLTRQKLESLTDIERQLSSRRSPDTTDNVHEPEKNAPEMLAPSSASKTEDDATP